ncbi:hypothetical protein [Burkholderia ambifaria]|uniref:hypothetical protein n=1 Tax=Burkholderia ambifaria TaxID=152480 RepID=UPI000F811F60|nr:hypothetical protein [Burkholderia ambifaria]
MSYAGQRYQLVARRQLPDGSYVAVNGPWDTYGVVTSSAPHPEGFLHQIRGVKKREGERPVAKF